MDRRQFILSLGVGMATLTGLDCVHKGPRKKLPEKPNILFIMCDDHASHAISCYGSRINKTPNIDRIAEEGIRFDNCFCTNSICSPSRAVILTGKHSHINGIRYNDQEFDGNQQTFPKLLQQAGYHTALIGKWHLVSEPRGFDYWNIMPSYGDYYNPDLIEMGEQKQYSGYVTDILTDICLDFLENRWDKNKPFLMMFHHKAPHRNWMPALRHLQIYDRVTIPEPDTLFDDYSTRTRAAREQEMSISEHMLLDYDLKMEGPPKRMNEEQKKLWEKAYAPKREALLKNNPKGKELVRWKYQRYMQDYLGCVAGLDESVGRVLDYLEESGLAKNTIVIYTSDQGFFLGDHGWFDKRFMYEESLRMPFLVRFPGNTKPGSINDYMVSNLDFAPTFLELAGLKKPEDMQGLSMKDLLLNKKIKNWRDSIYYHYYEYPFVHMVKRHYGVRTKKYKLIHFYYDHDAWELYDLEKDPHEMNNVYDNPNYSDIVVKLKSELERLQEYYGDSKELTQKFLKEDLARQQKVS